MFYEFIHPGSADYFNIGRGKNYSFPPHLHQCFEFIVIRSGEMQITVDGQNFLLKEKEALLIFPNQVHSLQSTECKYMLCIFSPLLVQEYATKIADRVPKNNKYIPDEYLVNALDKSEYNSSTTEKKGILYCLCGQFDRNADYEIRQADKEKLLFKIFSFVETHFRDDCSLANLSKTTGYDYSYLSRFFRQTVGISFNSYVNERRLSHACYLMENTNSPILQCALESGYTSLRTFNRNFKDCFKITPEQYRANTKKAAT